jgi:hypothetical protein
MSEQNFEIDISLGLRLIETSIGILGTNLAEFWANNQNELRHALTATKKKRKQPMASSDLKTEISLQATAKDLVFVLSELSSYLQDQ